jgi:hypothetical protein
MNRTGGYSMAGDLIALTVALIGLSVAIVGGMRVALQAALERRSAGRPLMPAAGEIVWCVVGVGPENTVHHRRIAAATHQHAAETARREIGELRVIGVSPVSM